MYLPAHFEEKAREIMHGLVRARPLATLVAFTTEGLTANHLPLIRSDAPGPHGSLHGHVPRANPLAALAAEGVPAVAIFHGPQGYVSPAFYPAKREHGRVVPTWNYAVVHAHGRLRVIDDTSWVRDQVERLTAQCEQASERPWQVSDAPADFTARLLASLVGLELIVERMTGKSKASQNQPEANRRGVVEGLEARGLPGDAELAALVDDGMKSVR